MIIFSVPSATQSVRSILSKLIRIPKSDARLNSKSATRKFKTVIAGCLPEQFLLRWDGPAQNAGLPVIKRQAVPRETRDRLDPESECGVTNDMQDETVSKWPPETFLA